MMHGALVRLRARQEADVAILDAELHDDIAQSVVSTGRPWRPISPGSSASEYRISDPDDKMARFSVVTVDGDELAGEASLWRIDTFNRSAHVGIALRRPYQGKGFGTDAVGVLCHYGFVVLGLHRLQVETLADNDGMLKAAQRNGFVREGVVRQAGWLMGGFADEVILGLLAHEWQARGDATG